MSKIDKLSILGVRSFSNIGAEVIEFYTPLTLIVGYNGSGKTTIIECLKYATTGDLPPNSRGGAFIHDPKLCGEKEVLAQVKLSLKTTAGAKMVATRSIQLTVKKTTRQQKTLEGSLLMVKDGDRVSISSRVAELDQMLPRCLGVSKAILDNVVFCHQDESLWPLSEPSVLKKKFDEIFEALKYTRAIENIKVLQKNEKARLNELKIEERVAKEDKKKAEKAHKRSEELGSEIQSLQDELASLAQQKDKASQSAKDAWQNASRLSKIVGEIQSKKIEAKSKQENVDSLKEDLQEMEDSDQELTSMLEKYEDREAAFDSDIHQATEEYGKIDASIKSQSGELQRKLGDEGSLKGEKRRYEDQLSARETLIRETASRHNLHGFKYDVDDAKVSQFREKLHALSKEQNSLLDTARREINDEVKAIQDTLQQLNSRKFALGQSKTDANKQIATNNQKVSTQRQLLDDRFKLDEGSRAALQSNVEDAEGRLERSRQDLKSADLDTKITEAEEQINKLEDQKVQIDEQLLYINSRSQEAARLDVHRKALKEKTEGLELVGGAHGERINRLLGLDWREDSIEASFQERLKRASTEVTAAEKQKNVADQQLEQLEYRLDTANNNLKQTKAQMQSDCNKLKDVLDVDPEDFPEQLAIAEDNREVALKDNESFSILTNYYLKAKEVLEQNKCCRLCQRQVTGAEVKALERVLDKNIQHVKSSADPKVLRNAEQDLKQLKDVQGHYDSWKKLSESNIPKLEAEVKKLEAERGPLQNACESRHSELQLKIASKNDLESLTKPIQNLVKYRSEILDLNTQIDELEAKQSQKGAIASIDEIQKQQREVNEQLRTLRRNYTDHTRERERLAKQATQLESDLRDARDKLKDGVSQLKEKSRIASEIDELLENSSEKRQAIESIDTELRNIAVNVSQNHAKLDEAQGRGDGRLVQLQSDVDLVETSVRELRNAEQEINRYLERGGTKRLEETQRQIESTRKEESRLHNELRNKTIHINTLKEEKANHSNTRQQIVNNLRYRRDLRSLKELRKEIEELETQNAREDHAFYTRESEKWDKERNRLAAEQGKISGQAGAKENQLAELLRDIDTDFKDAAYKYKEAHIKVEATGAAIEDLGRYGSALDKAIMKYHSLKMEEINHIIEELWHKTYQGSDVDTIVIRSDNEAVKGNKSYNYRVCMVKQDVEMDMRGRCSAGQKVLASIIIRLALAECFGVNCGLIALDEPTTNLDVDNVRALAQSLHDIIKVRQAQKNFQLIVITHDEEFLKSMHCAAFTDHYFRISRNTAQTSIIRKQSIYELQN